MARKKQPAARRQTRPSAAVLKATPPTSAQIVGYARVSTEDQNLDVQITALRGAGAQRLFVEKISALNAKRPQFGLMMKFLEPGDTLVFHAISRLGRDVKQILGILEELNREGVSWRSLTEPHLDATTAAGRLMLGITSVMAQFERDQIVDRTKRGMDECRRKGMYLGRPRLVDDAMAREMRRDRKSMTTDQIARKHGVSAGTVNKYAPARAKR